MHLKKPPRTMSRERIDRAESDHHERRQAHTANDDHWLQAHVHWRSAVTGLPPRAGMALAEAHEALMQKALKRRLGVPKTATFLP